MKAVRIVLPDKLAAGIATYVTSGWFASEEEVIRAALVEFVRRNRVGLIERSGLDDIDGELRPYPIHPCRIGSETAL